MCQFNRRSRYTLMNKSETVLVQTLGTVFLAHIVWMDAQRKCWGVICLGIQLYLPSCLPPGSLIGEDIFVSDWFHSKIRIIARSIFTLNQGNCRIGFHQKNTVVVSSPRTLSRNVCFGVGTTVAVVVRFTQYYMFSLVQSSSTSLSVQHRSVMTPLIIIYYSTWIWY